MPSQQPPSPPKTPAPAPALPKKTVTSPTAERIPHFLRLSIRDKMLFAQHLAVMLDAGITLPEALEILQEQIATTSFRSIMQIARTDLANGLPLSMSLGKFPSVFEPSFLNIVAVGEETGTLPDALRYMALQLEKSRELTGKVQSALVYPVIIFCGALGVGAYLSFFLLPRILPVFVSLKMKLPITTRILIIVSAWMRANGLLLLAGVIATIVVFSFIYRIKIVRQTIQRMMLAIPVFGTLMKQIQNAQLARILGTLLKSGVQIVPALKITAHSLSNLVYRKKVEEIATSVERGETIGAALRATPLFSRTAASMVGVGERTGKLADSLLSLAAFMESEVDASTKNLSALIEPLTLILVGALVGFIALSIITPIYQLTSSVSNG